MIATIDVITHLQNVDAGGTPCVNAITYTFLHCSDCDYLEFAAAQVKNLLEEGLTYFHLTHGSGYYSANSSPAPEKVQQSCSADF